MMGGRANSTEAENRALTTAPFAGENDARRRPLLQRARDRCFYAWNTRFRKWNYVFQYDPLSPRAPFPDGFRVERYDDAEGIPADTVEAVSQAVGERYTQSNINAIRRQGAIMWVGYVNGDIVGARLSRKGKFVPSWFIPLDEEDVIIYRGNTVSKHRGKGISPAMIQLIISREVPNPAHAYVDCRIYNTPSIRSISKSGFKLIALRRPLPRERSKASSAPPACNGDKGA